MNIEEVKALLSQTITSKEQFNAVLLAIDGRNARIHNEEGYSSAINAYYGIDEWTNASRTLMTLDGCNMPRYHASRWWLVREWLRITTGVYQITGPMEEVLNRFPELALHCAVKAEDPAMVAYTPDPQAGERDKQLSTSFGKLLRRLYPHLPDDAIRDAEAAHRAEVSNEIELVTGAKEIVAAYTNGVSSCMTHAASHWGLRRHPVEVYDAPGLALAVSRDSNKRVNGRSIVYINPADEKDKRFVRPYGDTSLTKRLKRAGYRNAGLEGALLKRIVAGKDDDDSAEYIKLVMPYLDRPQHSGVCVDDRYATSIVLDADPNYVRVIGADVAQRLREVTGRPVPSAQSTSGTIAVYKAVTLDALNATCPITGEKIDLSNSGSYYKAWVGGRVQLVVPAAIDGCVTARTIVDNRWESAYAPPGAPTFVYNDTLYIDTQAVRNALGFVQLAPDRYGPNQWAREDYLAMADGTYCREKDVSIVIGPGTMRSTVWSADTSDTKQYRVVHRLDGIRTVVNLQADPPAEVVRTTTGRHAVPGVHPVVKTCDGRWIFNRYAKSISSFGRSFVIGKNENIDGIMPMNERLALAVEDLRGYVQRSMSDFRTVSDARFETAVDNVLRHFILPRMPWRVMFYRDDGTWVVARYGAPEYFDALAAAEAMRDGQLHAGEAVGRYGEVIDPATFAAQQAFMFALRDEVNAMRAARATARADQGQSERFVVAA